MDPLELIDHLAYKARTENAPATHADVAAILRACRTEQSRGGGVFPLAWSAAASAIAASLVMVFALRAGALSNFTSTSSTTTTSADSVASLFNPVQMEMP